MNFSQILGKRKIKLKTMRFGAGQLKQEAETDAVEILNPTVFNSTVFGRGQMGSKPNFYGAQDNDMKLEDLEEGQPEAQDSLAAKPSFAPKDPEPYVNEIAPSTKAIRDPWMIEDGVLNRTLDEPGSAKDIYG